MKKGIAWIGHKGPKDGAWRRDLRTWIAGFLLSNLYVVPSLMALSTLTPHIVAAFAGFGVVVLVLLASAVLGEKLHRSDILYTAVIVLSTILLNIYEPSPGKGALTFPCSRAPRHSRCFSLRRLSLKAWFKLYSYKINIRLINT